MSPQFRSLIKKTSLPIVTLTLFFMGLRVILNYQRPCEPPCRPLRPAGQKVIKESSDERIVYLPQQQPLELTLELDKPITKANTRFTLHYKVSVRNLSDSMITTIRTDFFRAQESLGSRMDFYFKIWDPSGRELEPLYPLGEKDGVIPYDLDLGVIEEKDRLVDLAPGGVLRNARSVLRPFRWESSWREVREPDGVGTAIAKGKVRVQAKGWPAPAPGFRVLDGYRFESAGRYRIQAVYDDRHYTSPIYPVWNALPKVLAVFLGRLTYLGIDVTPQGFSSNYYNYEFHAESKVLEFEVMP